jgi:hypothetical protein
MKLNAALVERTLGQIEAEAIPEDHPVLPKLKGLFGDHTFFLDKSGLNIIEPMEEKPQTARLLNFAHVSVVYSGDLPIVPGDRNRIPTRIGDNAAISGIAPPINAGALREGLGFVDCHCCSCRSMSVAGRNSEMKCYLVHSRL